MNDQQDKKYDVHTDGGPVFNGGTFSNIEFVTNKFVMNGQATAPVVVNAAPADDAQEAQAPAVAAGEKVRHAIEVMRSESVLKKGYDLAWVMCVMNEHAEMEHFVTPQSFLNYLSANLGIGDLPSESTISKKARTRRGHHPAWTFDDTDDAREVSRRNNVANRFVSLMRK
jgi:hypothetical protein